jgi:gamma-glutamylcyclotransferase (GGCT)/AIG2-like uncharacterized protein YtfP
MAKAIQLEEKPVIHNPITFDMLEPDTNILVAVYGSLKKGFGNHRLLSDSFLLVRSECNTSDSSFTMGSLGSYPGVVEGGTDKIQVEIYMVSPEVLLRLDRLEGHPSFYKRKVFEFSCESEGGDEKVSAWMYIYQDTLNNRIKDKTLSGAITWRNGSRNHDVN